MAAGNLYFKIDFKLKDASGTEMIVNPAKVWDFNSGITNLATLKDYIKALFKLDDLVEFQFNYGGVNYYGFWGLITPSSFNSQFHNSVRHLEVRFPNTVVNKITMNDAGLNIIPYVRHNTIVSTQANAVRISPLLDVPFANPNVSLKLYWTLTRSGTPVSVGSESPVTINITSVDRGKTIDTSLNILNSQYVQHLDEIDFYYTATNEEGTWTDTSPSYGLTVSRGFVVWGYGAWPSQIASAPAGYITAYFNSNPFWNPGVVFYLNPTSSTLVSNGYYADFERWYYITSGEITDMGWLGDWPSGDPAIPTYTNAITHHGYRNTFLNMTSGYLQISIDYNAGTGWDSPATIYRSTLAGATFGKFYTSTAKTTFVANGFYVFPYGGGNYSTLLDYRYVHFAYIFNGVWTEYWEYDIESGLSEQIEIPNF